MPAQHGGLRGPGLWASFHQVQPHIAVELGVVPRRRVEHVSRQPAIARAGLDQIEPARVRSGPARRRGFVQRFPHLGELPGEEFAEQRPEIDAGEEVALASGPLAAPRVVAERFVVKRRLDELGDRQRAVVPDALEEEGVRGEGIGQSGQAPVASRQWLWQV